MLSLLKLKESIKVPVSIFSQKTSPLESLTKFLKENYDLKFTEIARMLNRDPRTIWSTYDSAVEKVKPPFELKEKELFIHIDKFSNRKFSILEIVCNHLAELGLSISEIATSLSKHRNTIWSTIMRFKKKNDSK